jgi:hypothetical protein
MLRLECSEFTVEVMINADRRVRAGRMRVDASKGVKDAVERPDVPDFATEEFCRFWHCALTDELIEMGRTHADI